MFVFPVKKFKSAINLIYIIESHSLSLAHTLPSGSQPKYVTFEYCWILTSPYCMSKVPIFLFLFLVEKRTDLDLYPP